MPPAYRARPPTGRPARPVVWNDAGAAQDAAPLPDCGLVNAGPRATSVKSGGQSGAHGRGSDAARPWSRTRHDASAPPERPACRSLPSVTGLPRTSHNQIGCRLDHIAMKSSPACLMFSSTNMISTESSRPVLRRASTRAALASRSPISVSIRRKIARFSCAIQTRNLRSRLASSAVGCRSYSSTSLAKLPICSASYLPCGAGSSLMIDTLHSAAVIPSNPTSAAAVRAWVIEVLTASSIATNSLLSSASLARYDAMAWRLLLMKSRRTRRSAWTMRSTFDRTVA